MRSRQKENWEPDKLKNRTEEARMNKINLSDLNLKILEAHCGMIMPKLGDTDLRNQLQRVETEIGDIYPPSGDAMKYWRFLNLNPDRVFSLAGTYNEIQLKENIILPMLTLAGQILPPFSADRCSEYPISHKDDRIHLEGVADLVYGSPPEELGELLRDPFLCVHEYKREKNPVEIFDAMAQLLGGMWILLKKNQDAGHCHPIYGLMVKGQTWRFAELHPNEKDDISRAVFDADGFFIRSDTDKIFRSLRHYFLLGGEILKKSG